MADRHRADAAHFLALPGHRLLRHRLFGRRLGCPRFARRFGRLLVDPRQWRGGDDFLRRLRDGLGGGFGRLGSGFGGVRRGRFLGHGLGRLRPGGRLLGGRPGGSQLGLELRQVDGRSRCRLGSRQQVRVLHQERLAFAHALRGFGQRLRIDRRGRVEADAARPLAHQGPGRGRQREQVVRGRPLLRQPGVEALLDRPRALAVAAQADHAAGALERVEGAPHRGHPRHVAARGAQRVELLVDARQDLFGFLDENRHQLGVRRRLRLRQGRRCRRRRRLDRRRRQHLRQAPGQRRIRLVEQPPGRRRRVARARLQRGVVGGQLAGPLVVLAGVGLDVALVVVAMFHRQRVQAEVVVVVGQFVAPRHRHVGAEDCAVGVPGEVAARPLRVLLQRLDEEADRAEVAGEAGEVRVVGRRERVGVAGHAGPRVVERRLHLFEAEQRQHARHLLEHAVERGQFAPLGRLPEESIEPLLDLAQQAVEFQDDRLHRQPVLCPPGQVRKPGVDGGRRLAAAGGVEPFDHRPRAAGELLVEARQFVDADVDQQQRRGHLDGQRLPQRQRRLRHLAGERAEFDQQLLDRAEFQRRGRATRGLHVTDEGGGVAADGGLVPARLGFGQRLAQHAHLVGVEQHQLAALVVGRQQGVDVVQLARLGHPGHARVGTADVVQRVDQQTLGHRRAAVDQAAQLQVDPRQDPLELDVDRQRVGFQRVEQAAHHPPEAARQPALRQALEVGQRLAHVVPRLHVRRVAQELQQGALETDPAHAQLVGGHRPHVDPGQRRAARQVREHQVGRVDPRRAEQLQQVAVVREQADRLVGAAGAQTLQIGGQRLQRALQLAHRGGGALAGRSLPALEQLLDRIQQQRRAAQVEHAQRAARLVHLRDGGAQRRRIALVAEELPDAGQRGVRGDAYLAGQPRQRRRVGARLDQRLRHRHFAHRQPRVRLIRRPGNG
ncbi:MAG: hypothetical protein MUF32_01590 [Burkholderiaceae bacterium]|nr:hypothetical protein [Burkholderiaceae bacterium]